MAVKWTTPKTRLQAMAAAKKATKAPLPEVDLKPEHAAILSTLQRALELSEFAYQRELRSVNLFLGRCCKELELDPKLYHFDPGKGKFVARG